VSGAKIDKLARMANQIGDAFSAMSEPDAVRSAATHLKLYWTPKMIHEIVTYSAAGQTHLNAIAAAAVATLKRNDAG
jgi:hypothetical protein